VMKQEKNEYMRDSAIQRFEFTFELTWKTIKVYLEEKMGAKGPYFPKETFRNAFQAGLIDDDPRWLEMVDTRNKTSHIYNEKMAEEVYSKLSQYVPLIDAVLKKL